MNLIDRDAVLARIEEHKKLHPNALLVITYAEMLITEAPIIDPVEHGHWIIFNHKRDDYVDIGCSICGTLFDEPIIYYDYCPNCGAKMDEVTE